LPGGHGVRVAFRVPYLASISARIAAGLFPACVPTITSRVMSVQWLQPAA